MSTQKPFFKFIENWLSVRRRETERDRSRIYDMARRTLNLINKSCWRNTVWDEATVLPPLIICKLRVKNWSLNYFVIKDITYIDVLWILFRAFRTDLREKEADFEYNPTNNWKQFLNSPRSQFSWWNRRLLPNSVATTIIFLSRYKSR